MEEKIVYFESAGKNNTGETLNLAIERARARGVKTLVLASTRGDTARQAAEMLKGTGVRMIVVPHQPGFMSGMKFPAELVTELENQGHAVQFGTMFFHTERFYGTDAPRALANILRTFCQGMKVCVEIILMAADGGKIAGGEQVVAVAGTGRGADTAVVAIAATSPHVPDLHITEIICKPLQTRNGPPPPPPAEKRP